MRKYKQLTQEQRYHIYVLHKIGKTQTMIAKEVRVSKSTISRELSRNGGLRGYRPIQANNLALQRRHTAAKAVKFTAELLAIIEAKLANEQWSPEQTSGWLKENNETSISHERIYQHILKEKASFYLCKN